VNAAGGQATYQPPTSGSGPPHVAIRPAVTAKATRQRRSDPGKPGQRLKLSKWLSPRQPRVEREQFPRCYVLSGGVIFVASIHGDTVRLRRSSRAVKRSKRIPVANRSGTRLTLLALCLWRTQADVGIAKLASANASFRTHSPLFLPINKGG
jgi:hypothetical protein